MQRLQLTEMLLCRRPTKHTVSTVYSTRSHLVAGPSRNTLQQVAHWSHQPACHPIDTARQHSGFKIAFCDNLVHCFRNSWKKKPRISAASVRYNSLELIDDVTPHINCRKQLSTSSNISTRLSAVRAIQRSSVTTRNSVCDTLATKMRNRWMSASYRNCWSCSVSESEICGSTNAWSSIQMFPHLLLQIHSRPDFS